MGSINPTEPLRVLIVDDHPLVRTGLKQLLGQDTAVKVCGEAETVEQALVEIEKHCPHVVLVDLALPGMNGMELIKRIKKHWPGIKIIVVSSFDQGTYGPLAEQCGADRYLNKHEAGDQIIKAIHSVTDQEADENPGQEKTCQWFG